MLAIPVKMTDETRSGGKVDSPTALSSQFDDRRPWPIQYSDCLKMILQEINQNYPVDLQIFSVKL